MYVLILELSVSLPDGSAWGVVGSCMDLQLFVGGEFDVQNPIFLELSTLIECGIQESDLCLDYTHHA